jgi:LacI family transcriptional regulator
MPEIKKTRITSIKEIAKLADCSIATVSNIINEKGRISEPVRKKVLKICREHQYVPRSGGRNLRLGRNETIGLLFFPSCASIFRNIYYAEIMEALEAEMEARGHDLLLSGYDVSQSSSETPRFIRQGKVDGVILLGRFPRSEILRIQNYGIPAVQLDGYRDRIKMDYVTTDGFAACDEIVEHLVGLGHSRIVFMAYKEEDSNAERREMGFNFAISKHSLSKKHSLSCRDFSDSTTAYQSLSKLLQGKHPPTALIAVNDTLAAELQSFLQAKGYTVPDDISIFGFNNDAHSLKSKPQISTVNFNKEMLGKMGAEMIIRRVTSPDVPAQGYSLACELIHRDSVAPPPAT